MFIPSLVWYSVGDSGPSWVTVDHTASFTELLTGRIPYYNLKVPSTIIAAKFRGTLPDTSQFPELPASDPLWKLLTRCWDAEPVVRPTMAEVIQEV